MNNNLSSPVGASTGTNKATLIHANTLIEGNIISGSVLNIQGTVLGDINAKTVIIENNASCKGKVNSNIAVISGQFDGDIVANHVDVKSSATISGSIQKKTISVDTGAKINAKISSIK
ncbi:MAG: polymer-forming cytoskeletal protein [Rhizobiales bacterium]|nr:polymer-forming cytoskeletal protein [Hyphomicrobiales bacterium]